MRSKTVAAGLLILVFGASAFGCVAGWNGDAPNVCGASIARKSCARKKAIRTTGCHVLHSSPGRCSLRSLAQGYAIEFARFEIRGPLNDVRERASVLRTAPILISSVGSPETDRGPPRS
jgi:hypothetical protein